MVFVSCCLGVLRVHACVFVPGDRSFDHSFGLASFYCTYTGGLLGQFHADGCTCTGAGVHAFRFCSEMFPRLCTLFTAQH